MASLDEVVTGIKNLVTAINGAANTFGQVNGLMSKAAISAPVLLRQGAGRVAKVAVITAGSSNGFIYDSTDITSTSNPLYLIINTTGIVDVNMPCQLGLVVRPGSGQVVSVSYS